MMFYVLKAFLVSFCWSVPPEFFRSFVLSEALGWDFRCAIKCVLRPFISSPGDQTIEVSSFYPPAFVLLLAGGNFVPQLKMGETKCLDWGPLRST